MASDTIEIGRYVIISARDLLRLLVQEVELHNAEYQHRTGKKIIADAQELEHNLTQILETDT